MLHLDARQCCEQLVGIAHSGSKMDSVCRAALLAIVWYFPIHARVQDTSLAATPVWPIANQSLLLFDAAVSQGSSLHNVLGIAVAHAWSKTAVVHHIILLSLCCHSNSRSLKDSIRSVGVHTWWTYRTSRTTGFINI